MNDHKAAIDWLHVGLFLGLAFSLTGVVVGVFTTESFYSGRSDASQPVDIGTAIGLSVMLISAMLGILITLAYSVARRTSTTAAR